MPRLPVVSGRQAIKALRKLGFVQARQRGSHVVMRNGVRGTVMPLHREIDTGTLAAIIKQAGVAVDAFCAAL